jgi:hypothetical protein
MSVHEQIVKSIGAQGLWKGRLRKAVDSGTSDVSVTVARQDTQCDFGKWLYGSDLSKEDKQSTHYNQCRRLHQQFHLEAAKVLTFALANKQLEANQAMEPRGGFATCSGDLTKAMMDWDNTVPH